MKVALVNPCWSFDGSIYFGCREAHLPLEYGYARALLEAAGHEVKLFDGQLARLTLPALTQEVREFSPELCVITTAPSYLFWRCAPPELRVPLETARALRDACQRMVVVGPHAATTPRATLRKLPVDAAVLGECEEVLCRLAADADWSKVDSLALRERGGVITVRGKPAAVDVAALPALTWEPELLKAHRHHHHRFERAALGPGAEVEASRGCPYHCTFCAKDNFRNAYRKRPLEIVLDEIDALIAGGVTYVYFVDEIFLPDRKLLTALCERPLAFGVQMRIDNWSHELLDLLGAAGCVSIEAGVESVTQEGRSLLAKRCKLTTSALAELLLHARKTVPFVQANLLDSKADKTEEVQAWRARLQSGGVWSNDPVPLFPYPGSPDYVQRWGVPDDMAWERAHAQYLHEFTEFSDIQSERPLSLAELEAVECHSPAGLNG